MASFGLRVANRAQREVIKATGKEKEVIPSSFSGSESAGFMGGEAGGNNWLSGRNSDSYGDWKRR